MIATPFIIVFISEVYVLPCKVHNGLIWGDFFKFAVNIIHFVSTWQVLCFCIVYAIFHRVLIWGFPKLVRKIVIPRKASIFVQNALTCINKIVKHMGFLLFFISFFLGGGIKKQKTVKETGYGHNLSWKFLNSSFHFCCSQVF